ncbi:Os07g0407350 [Oryza sativa Japonica Group]|uniref:Os07g0407350 protein n=2 Tax=Oryza sativa subsp. japonica TaxID=39947 RepID=C7J4K9_ORYSJ|nr:hypothetical protein EE612_038628 [Oryza sativa]BAH93883.1 Os07g0407350 [Oryza sativa Japonica Group]BAT01100.1 Os07g0407350 [Oryza sativa Japonica Group]|eukprot:NP_001175155.1 Os07g0407350 [Oryza sativa Japonica Group]
MPPSSLPPVGALSCSMKSPATPTNQSSQDTRERVYHIEIALFSMFVMTCKPVEVAPSTMAVVLLLGMKSRRCLPSISPLSSGFRRWSMVAAIATSCSCQPPWTGLCDGIFVDSFVM